MNRRRVVVTGVGVVSPLGLGAAAFWEALRSGHNAISRIDAFDPSHFASQMAGQVRGYKTTNVVPKNYRRRISLMARDIELAVGAAYYAVQDAGLITRSVIERGEHDGRSPNVNPARFGANIGAGLICADLPELAGALATAADPENRAFDIRRWGAGGRSSEGAQYGMGALTPLWLLKFLPNMLACHVTIIHDCQAPSNTITCGEASSHLAIGEAARTIERGAADVCICGGAESKINPMGLIRQSLLGRLSPTAHRPFAADRDGMLISEGGALLILEELEHARARGARIYAEVAGFGASTDTGDMRCPSADGRGTASAVRKALKDADASAADVDAVVAAGVGTVAHDVAEVAGLRVVFGSRFDQMPVTATKGGQGNNGAGSGALDLAAAVLAMHHQCLPPTVGTSQVSADGPLGLVMGAARDSRLDVVVSTAAALGAGQNAAIVLRRLSP